MRPTGGRECGPKLFAGSGGEKVRRGRNYQRYEMESRLVRSVAGGVVALPPPRRRHQGRALRGKTLVSHLITGEFNSPTNYLRTAYVRVEPLRQVGLGADAVELT
eukprot:3623113-Pyramimonas_sp.AAC.1